MCEMYTGSFRRGSIGITLMVQLLLILKRREIGRFCIPCLQLPLEMRTFLMALAMNLRKNHYPLEMRTFLMALAMNLHI